MLPFRTSQTLVLAATLLSAGALCPATGAQQQPQTPPAQQTPQAQPDQGPVQDNAPVVRKRKYADPEPEPPAPEQPKDKTPKELQNYTLRVDVPVVNVDVSVQLDKTRQFVPGLKAGNFRVLEDGVPQRITEVRQTTAPITAVMLLEFAANSWAFIQDMRQSSYVFFKSLKPEDYIAVITYDLRTHILTDFTKDKQVTAQALQTLTIPGFSDTDEFDALYETLDRVSRIDGRKYIILISSGRDTFSKITLDTMLKKVQSAQNVSIYCISTGGLLRTLADGRMGAIARMDYLQADNQMRTFAQMTGGRAYFPRFEGELPDIFSEINQSIRNQYIITYRPTNTAQDGTYRKIKVELVDNEGMPLQMVDEKNKKVKYTVAARDGYKARMPVE
ncbi:VWA domain-containing protein [Terriglobus aquaticus]|uniref:VWA domain-containing protein n=1 Tax=Terriglobus aquaticus TaxID=940139 RepID=A0ABW9KI87_9BACT|nr:VWA domain-containing protein [Terriglobus aquaticus]